jgi:hypothetical protein
LPEGAVAALLDSMRTHPDALHYFGLRFADGPRLLRLTEVGVAMRCVLFGIPFGDQAFCLPRRIFDRLGGFDEQVPYGEDHLFVWKARHAGVRLKRVHAIVGTSGRKYADHGWLRITLRHVVLTLRQALPAAVRCVVR